MFIPEHLYQAMLPLITRIDIEHKEDIHLKEKMHFQKDNAELHRWLDTVFTQGILDGDKGLEEIVHSILDEKDQILQLCKFLYTYQIWGFFGEANAAEVSSDLILQGHTRDTLNRAIRIILFNEIENNSIKKENPRSEDDEDYDLEQDTNDNSVGQQPTFH